MWERVLRWGGAILSAGADDPAVRGICAREISARNVRILRRLLPVLTLHFTIATIVFSRSSGPTPAHVAWLETLWRLNAALAGFSLLGSVVAIRGWLPWAGARLGDLVGLVFLLGTAAISANSQRVHPNLNSFSLGALGVAFVLHVDHRVYLGGMLAASALVGSVRAHFAANDAASAADNMSLLGVVAISMGAFFVCRTLRIREIVARVQVERLNGELEQRVASQVHEIVARAHEVEDLNTQLNHKVRERSRELTMALARLAAEHEGLPSGTVLGDRVEIDYQIGQGGMGAVYRGRDLATGKVVAVKVVQAGSATELDGLYRFLREAQALASLIHPAIVRSYHVDVADDGRLFQMMELVEGEALQSYIDRGGSLPCFQAARLGAVLAEGLAAAHAAGIVHRDVKPANVMLTRGAPGLKLLDFGISKLRDVRQSAGGTQGAVIGTPEFLSPEQVNDPTHVGDRADVYALGIVLYLCMAGRFPYDLQSARSWLFAHSFQPPTNLESLVPDIDREVARTVMSCLRKIPAERPAASALAQTFSALADAKGIPALEHLNLCTRNESGAPPALLPDEPSPTGDQSTSQRRPWRRTLKAQR